MQRPRRFELVEAPGDAPPATPDVHTVVLDSAWTPGPADAQVPAAAKQPTPVRPAFNAVVEGHNLFAEALAIVDAWAEASGAPDRLVVDGVSYWFRVREPMWHWVHERLLWRHTLRTLVGDGRYDAVRVPAPETALVDILRALAMTVDVAAPSPEPSRATAAPTTPAAAARPAARVPSPKRGLVRLLRPVRALVRHGGTPPTAGRGELGVLVGERIERIMAQPGPRAIVLTLPSSYQRLGGAADGVRRDPNLGSVIPALREAGIEPIVVGWNANVDSAEDRALIEGDEQLLPASLMRRRWRRQEDAARSAHALATMGAAVDSVRGTPLRLDGADLTDGFADALRSRLLEVVEVEARELAWLERTVRDLRPDALVVTQEHHRTPWILAARNASVPTFAIQHGVLYPAHPGYPGRRHPALVLPSVTFTYGGYERGVLLGMGYREDEVAVAGSPRLDLDRPAPGAAERAAQRAAVREEMGVAPGDRMLVVSTVPSGFVRRAHFVHMLDRVLGGPLPGVHLVFKQHPGERDAGPYRDLLGGLADAGGYAAPPMTIVRDVDLYRLLRAADAHLGLQSTVLTDAVVAGVPNLIAAVEPGADLLGYTEAGVATPVRTPADVLTALADPQPAAAAARAAFLADHFGGGEAGRRIAETVRERVARGVPGGVA